jgi:Skp family chaperone for outer membrane proteins
MTRLQQIQKILNSLFQPFRWLFSQVSRAFYWSSGADLDILDQVPTEKNKYFGIGGTIIFTALMASFAGGYAFFTAFKDPQLSIFFGLFWGALIFNLDRYIVSTFGVGDGKKTISRQEVAEAAPRIVMAVVLGFVIATPLELKLFEREINAEISRKIALANIDLARELSQESNEIIIGYQDELRKIKAEIKSRQADLDRRYKNYQEAAELARNEELFGAVSGTPDCGPICRQLKATRDELESAWQEMQTLYRDLNAKDREREAELGRLIDEDEKRRMDGITRNERVQEQNDGLMARLEAMGTLTEGKPSLLFARILITMLFIFIEIAPILFKMMTERGPYDDILDRIKHEIKVQQLEAQSNVNEEINNRVRINTGRHKEKLAVEMMANKELLASIAEAQAEIAAAAIATWKEEQIKKVTESSASMINPESAGAEGA